MYTNEVAQDNIIILTGAYITATGPCPWFKNSLKKECIAMQDFGSCIILQEWASKISSQQY